MDREKDIEAKLLVALCNRPESVQIHNSSISGITNCRELLKQLEFEHFPDHSDWNPAKEFMKDIIGGMCPDIVLRSKLSGENRIYMEVKNDERLAWGRYDVEDSQVIRYFLHLLATSTKNPKDIGRAVLLCAPSHWFVDTHNAKAWGYFVEHFSGLATKFDIAIGEIRADELPTSLDYVLSGASNERRA